MNDALSDDRIETLVEGFALRNRSLNRSNATTRWHSDNLRDFVGFLHSRKHSLRVDEITPKVIRAYIIHLQSKRRYDSHPLTPVQEQKLSPQTVRARVVTLKAFFAWLQRDGYTEHNVMKNIESPQVPQRLMTVLSQEEVERILSAVNPRTPLGRRDLAIMMSLLDTGIRCAELSGLKLGDVHISRGYLKVMGKGSRERLVPLGATARRALIEYIRSYRPASTSENVFLTETGKPMTVGGIQLMIRRLGRRCGVSRLHAHLCRHTFATNYLMSGGDIFTLQQILGHSSLEMVRRYVNLSSEYVIGQHNRFSPLDTMHPRINRHPRRRLSSRSRPRRVTD
jgi:site-specific recombinase XerD